MVEGGAIAQGLVHFLGGRSNPNRMLFGSILSSLETVDTNHIFHRAWNIFACLFVDGAPGLVNVDHSWCQHSEDSNFYIPVRSLPRGIIPIKLRADMQTDKHTTYNVNPGAIVEGSLEVKLPTIWTDEKQSRAEAERRGRLVERRSEEKE